MEVAATSRDVVQYFSPGTTPCSIAARTFSKLQVSERAIRARRLVRCLSSAVLRLQEPLDPACRPSLRFSIDYDDVDEDEVELNGEHGSSYKNAGESADAYANNSKGGNVGDPKNIGIIPQAGSPNGALSNWGTDSASSLEVDVRERLRRERIGLANKGKTPWNKGKSHSPETIALMKERNKIVMQDPTIREKLRQHSHPQSEETREKIRIFMKSRMESERRQLTIVQEWKDSIAKMARTGIVGDGELQWDSYQVLKKELHGQYYAAKKKKKKGCGAKSLQLEHRLRISESVRAKWSDPEYRNKVVERIHETRQKGPRIFKGELIDPEFDLIINSVTSASRSGSSSNVLITPEKVGSYNDPLAEEKLKKIKMLRERNTSRKESEAETEMVGFQFLEAEDGSSEEKKEMEINVEALDAICNGLTLGSAQVMHMAAERARILLAEAERAAVLAAQALDAAGAHDESLSDSLLEAWTLLDEANQSILNSKVNKSADKLM